MTSDGVGHFIVTAGRSEGTDTLSGIEKIDGAGSANILLVGNGGYATIQAAIDAANPGDTILVGRDLRRLHRQHGKLEHRSVGNAAQAPS